MIASRFKKSMICIALIPFMLAMTGCSVKFIEKVPEESTQESEQFTGDIKIDSEEESSSTSESTDDFATENTDEPEPETPKEPEEAFDVEVGGIKFKYDEMSTTLYSLVDHVAKTSPHENGKDYASLKKGDIMAKKGESLDGVWCMVKVSGGPSVYVRKEDVTEEYVEPEKSLNGLETESTKEQPPEPQESSQTSESEQKTESSEKSSQQEPPEESVSQQQPAPEPTPEPEPVDTYTGISFPSNASSTSYNMGVEFADLTVTLYIRKDSVSISNGPGKISNSTGFYSMGVLNQGDSVRCTGIGRNGWVRIEYGGEIGFVNGMDVEY